MKSSEGLGRLLKSVLISEFKSGFLNMLGAFIAQRAFRSISERLNPSRYNGASLLGLRGVVFKSHGGADVYGYECAIQRAFDAARSDVLSRVSMAIAALMPQPDLAVPSAPDHQTAAPVALTQSESA